MDHNTAWQIVTDNVKDPGLRRHMLSVEAAMRFYADKLGGDVDEWAAAGLVHDFDWELHPDLERHPRDGASVLRDRGCSENIVQAVLSHNTAATGIERSRPIDFALLACDEITGLIVACVLVRPSKDIGELKLKSIKKKWKDKAFAAGVDRQQVEAATADFSEACFQGELDQWDHIANVLQAMQTIDDELDLSGPTPGSTR